MGKRRNTAKTGDKALYKGRDALETKQSNRNNDDDPMYDEVDRFHNDREKEFLRLDGGASVGSDDDDDDKVETIMDLAAGGSSSDDDSEDDDSSSDENVRRTTGKDDDDDESVSSAEEGNEVSSSDDDDDDDDIEQNNVRAWGSKKSSYYHGDSVDVGTGRNDDEEFDAELEEKAAKEVQALRYKEMSEDDFVLSDAGDDENDISQKNTIDEKSATTKTSSSSKIVTKLSVKEQRKIIEKQHPEMLPLLSHFATIVEELQNQTAIASRAIFESEENTAESVGTTKLGQKYLLTKTMLQSSAALNLIQYLLLKSHHQKSSSIDQDDGIDPALVMQNHPVMVRLQKIDSLMQQLEEKVEDKVDGLKEQLSNLVKAASLLESNDFNSSAEGSSDNDEEVDSIQSDRSVSTNDPDDIDENASASSDKPPESDDEEDIDKGIASRNALMEARFGLRPNEIAIDKKNVTRKRSRLPNTLDAGDDDYYDEVEETRRKRAMQALAKTVNSIEQRSATRNRRPAPVPEHLDDHEDDDGELRRGLAMMEEELGKISDEEEHDDNNRAKSKTGVSDSDGVDGEIDNDFYGQVSKRSISKRDARKQRYQVEPKFPRMDPEVEGERAISKQILKNRGLVAHKNKMNRNPRVKKREQYRKALIRRKGTVRDIRTNEGHQYGGEETGIKTNLSRSRKLAR